MIRPPRHNANSAASATTAAPEINRIVWFLQFRHARPGPPAENPGQQFQTAVPGPETEHTIHRDEASTPRGPPRDRPGFASKPGSRDRPEAVHAHARRPSAPVRVHDHAGRAEHELRLRTVSPAQGDRREADQWVPPRVGAVTDAAFRSVVGTAKANGASFRGTVQFVLSARQPRGAFAGVE